MPLMDPLRVRASPRPGFNDCGLSYITIDLSSLLSIWVFSLNTLHHIGPYADSMYHHIIYNM